jgi:hypothetical protein
MGTVERTGLLCFALAISACSGGSSEAPEETSVAPAPTSPAPPEPAPPSPPAPTPPNPPDPTPPAPPAPTPPSPTPPPGNAPPVVSAGSDQTTVEEQDVQIDGSATRDANNDALSFSWTLAAAPAGSGVTVGATTPTFMFRPDLPGEYRLQLTVTDGKASVSDTVKVTADRLFRISAPAKFSIDGASPAGSDQVSLAVKMSPHYRGAPVAFTATSSQPWLVAPASGALGGGPPVALRLDLAQVRTLENGAHTARVTISPVGGWSSESSDVTLNLALPRVRNVFPYVTYTGEPTPVTLRGEKLASANGQSLFIGGVEALGIVAASDTRATIDLPPLAAGTYTVRIGHALDVARETARVVVRAPPVYQDFDIFDAGATPGTFAYDAERDTMWYTMRPPATGEAFGVRLRNDGTGNWVSDLFTTPLQFEPDALALSADGTELLVTSHPCQVHRIDPDTFAVRESSQLPDCPIGTGFHGIAPLADGRVLLFKNELNDDTSVYEFPGFARADVLPSRRGAFALLNHARNRLIYVQPAGLEPQKVDVWDLGGRARAVQLQAQPNVLSTNLSMSADGARTLHATDVYDRDVKLLGRLAGSFGPLRSVLNYSGTRTATVDFSTNAVYVHDLTGPGPEYPLVGTPLPLPEDIEFEARVFVPPTGGAVFVFGFVPEVFRGHYRFSVRLHPGLTR